MLRGRGWSNKAIARELGVHASTVGRWFPRTDPAIIVAVTDGDASHPDSPTVTPARLASLRISESRRACAALGLPEPVRAGLPDGGVRGHETRLADAIAEAIVVAVKRLYLLDMDDQPTGTYTFTDLLREELA